MNAADALIEYLIRKTKAVNPEVLEKARDCLLDFLGVTTAGAWKTREQWDLFLRYVPAGKAALYGYGKTADSKTAALINGFNAHALELDDGQRFAMIHLGAAVISAIDAASSVFPVAEDAFLRGIVMGYEAACRVAVAMQPSHKQKGYHTAGTCGTIGAALGVAFALGMDKKQLKKVLTAAAGSSAGLLEIQEQGSEMKPYNLGRAAMDGLTAAYMGLSGFEAPEDMLGGERGFFNTFSDQWDLEKLIGPQDYFEIQRIYVKPYASCRHSHSAIEAALRLKGQVNTDEIEEVLVETYKLGVKGHDHREIRGVASAKLSTPYAVAAALLYGRADLSVFEPLDEKAAALAQKVAVQESQELTAESPQKRIAVVTVKTRGGKILTERVDYAKGDPENPMSREEITEKIRLLVGEEHCREMLERVLA